LYDLCVTADNGICDTAFQAVKIVPTRKLDYYFIQVTDPHLPTHLFYTNPAYPGDSSSMNDLRAIIDDINLLNPEFVLLTGDLINEGELETPFYYNGEYLDQKYYSRAQRILREFKVPVYLTSGNHDINGWKASPQPDGTARHHWWSFFGWKHLENPTLSAPWNTQDYSFDYNQIHFIGMESYVNDDGWRSEVYGATSCTQAQMDWFAADLAAVPAGREKVLFTHYDFKNQFNLAQLGIQLMLNGHMNVNEIASTNPYKLLTCNATDGKRAFRVIRVSQGKLAINPDEVCFAGGGNGTSLQQSYNPSNDGSATTVSATVTNTYNAGFANGLLKFKMPAVKGAVTVSGGTLFQIDTLEIPHVYYVNVSIPAAASVMVTVAIDTNAALGRSCQTPLHSSGVQIRAISARGINIETTQSGIVTLSFYNADGKCCSRIGDCLIRAGANMLHWKDKPIPAGLYIVALSCHAADGKCLPVRYIPIVHVR
jgi:hypothetical protein